MYGNGTLITYSSQRKGAILLMKLTKDQLLELYYWMVMDRELDEKISVSYRQGKIVGLLHQVWGQEAVNVGAAYALKKGDFYSPSSLIGGAPGLAKWPKPIIRNWIKRKKLPTGITAMIGNESNSRPDEKRCPI